MNAAALTRAVAAALDKPAEGSARAALGRRMVQTHYERRLVFDRLAALLTAE